MFTYKEFSLIAFFLWRVSKDLGEARSEKEIYICIQVLFLSINDGKTEKSKIYRKYFKTFIVVYFFIHNAVDISNIQCHVKN